MGTGFVLSGARRAVAGLDVTSYLDHPSLALRRGEDSILRPPGTWIRAVVIHTTKGLRSGDAIPGFGPPVDAGERVARYWATDGRNAGAHLIIDHDGKVFQTADLITEEAYGCPKWNTGGVHIELYQGRSGEIYEGQLGICVRVVDFLTGVTVHDPDGRTLCVQRQIPELYIGPVSRLVDGDESATGVFGHRDLARNRGPGDPGNHIFNRLGLAGYDLFNYDHSAEREEWRRRQRTLGMKTADGVAGPLTRKAIAGATLIPGLKGTRPLGLWVARPGDELLVGA